MLPDHIQKHDLGALDACVQAYSASEVIRIASRGLRQCLSSKRRLLLLQTLKQHLDLHAGIFLPELAPVSGF